MKKILWIGDAVVSSGFARCTHEILRAFVPDWDVHVLGLNYHGDPHDWPYKIYPASARGDAFGLRRVKELVSLLRPDVVVVQNDPWNVPSYVELVGNVPVIAVMPVDGKNVSRARELNGLLHAIFWTEFGKLEAQRGGYSGPASIIPLGVDIEKFHPVNRKHARQLMQLPPQLTDAFIVGNTNRNQPRKRLDLTVEYFAEWVRRRDVDDAYLYLHVAPTGDLGYDLSQLMSYYGLSHRLILATPPIGPGAHESTLNLTYNCFNVQVSTTQGEGWGLTTAEGMACGIPQIVPDWAALGEWAQEAALLARCSNVAVTPNYVNVFGGVPDRDHFIELLDLLYQSPSVYHKVRSSGLELVAREQFRWSWIGRRFREVVEEAVFGRPTVLKRQELVGA